MTDKYRIISDEKVDGRGDPIAVGTLIEIDDPKQVLRWSKAKWIDPRPVRPKPAKKKAETKTATTRTDDD